MAWKVLVTARAFWVSGKAAHQRLERAGCEVIFSPEAGPVPEDRLIPLLQGCQAVIASSDPYNTRVFQASQELRLVARCGVGIDAVDLNAATEAGVIITNTPGAMTEAVADYTFGLMLAIARKIAEGDALMRSGGWGEYPGVLVTGKTLGLVGFGQIGQAVARRAGGFGMRILTCDPYISSLQLPKGLPPIESVTLDELLAQSDFVSAHLPSLPETRHLFNAERFAKMKPTAYFINTARGALVDETALVDALEAGIIAGAGIDVYDHEPVLPDHPLRRAPRCVVTPHNAFNAVECVEEMNRLCVDSILALMKDETPPFVCNPDVWRSPALQSRKELH